MCQPSLKEPLGYVAPRVWVSASDAHHGVQESKAGLAVGKLRSHKTKAVSEAAKELVKQWKTAVEKDKATKKPANGAATGEQSIRGIVFCKSI